ncbi:MAG: hypothetical protein M3N98_09320 [Actinomycetota bacterium]|nr:hypothetical protein [Actinomycetota bacterium]
MTPSTGPRKLLGQLINEGAVINFRTIANAGDIPVNFHYTSPTLRARIEQLRAQQNEAGRPSPERGARTDRYVICPLTAKLAAERHRHHKRRQRAEDRTRCCARRAAQPSTPPATSNDEHRIERVWVFR